MDVVNLVTAVLTLGALIVAYRQLLENNTLARQNFARQMWTDYLKLGLQYPELGETTLALRELHMNNVAELVGAKSRTSQQYLWFLTIMLDACESVKRYLPAEEWESTLIGQLRFHREALELVWSDPDDPWKINYGKELDELMMKAIGARQVAA